MKFQAAAIAAIAATFLAFGIAGSAEARPGAGNGWGGPGLGGPGQVRQIAIVNRRIANQQRRIRRAWRQGRLTRGEGRRVRIGLQRIRGLRARYLRDGFLSRPEFRHLRRSLNQNSRRIARLANNRRIAPRGGRLSRFNGF